MAHRVVMSLAAINQATNLGCAARADVTSNCLVSKGETPGIRETVLRQLMGPVGAVMPSMLTAVCSPKTRLKCLQ